MKEEVLERKAGGTGSPAKTQTGLEFRRYFTREGISPFDLVEWEYRTAAITSESGEVIFEQKNVEVPKSWSMMATNIVASKYFHGTLGTAERETSVRQLIGRVATTIARWGGQGGYFSTEHDTGIFQDELVHLLIHQMMAFNSPVWFNCGVEEKPQCSACFINSVEDTMSSILELTKTEGMLFKWGSGTGSNLSPIRSSKEQLSGGGIASGPVSFMKGFDAFAGVIKSGGKTRRAAKMVILNAAHPDIVEFINSKANEEKKAWVLLDNGYAGGVDGEAYSSIFFQNANHSVRVTDEFMQAVANDGEWTTRAITTGEPMETYKARGLMRMIAESAYVCGDPGMQYDTTINRWHTAKNTAPINASNPCSEYMFLDDSACNLASLNLMKFVDKNGRFDIESFRKAVDITITAQEIIVGFASYPTKKIEINSFDYRPLGLGYANLGALLMSQGVAYDSDHGRHYAAAITAMMTGEAYLQSAKIAGELGPCAGFDINRKPFLDVMRMHRESVKRINRDNIPVEMYDAAWNIWSDAVDLGVLHGYRNSQASVLAPTGTIGFMMDCDTTGIEPDLALVKYKKLVGGGTIKIVNNTVPPALRKLGYDDSQVKAIVDYVNENGTIEGAPDLKDEHLPVFDCAFKPVNGARSIHYMGHLKMMGAVQPFISGAMSKTVNLPSEVTVEQIEQVYTEGWRLGLKAVAVYRDGSKRTQPLSTSATEKKNVVAESRPVRRHLPVERHSITHKFSLAGHEGYLTIGMYEDGTPGEIFIVMAKEGSTLSGVMDSFATTCSMALQYGVPLKVLVDKFSHTRFEPSGYTSNPQVPYAKSVMDYIFRYLASKFLPAEEAKALGVQIDEPPLTSLTIHTTPVTVAATTKPARKGALVDIQDRDAPVCFECGSLMVRNGACYKCLNCGSTSGCS
ncbi:MAG: vitamin B12-dependent ribonucleotide reductase [Acidobacteria bacterium]|nr:MAG: vitamin B12-dependent ribonucleotide reductase [Acidobacteriota bacterium]